MITFNKINLVDTIEKLNSIDKKLMRSNSTTKEISNTINIQTDLKIVNIDLENSIPVLTIQGQQNKTTYMLAVYHEKDKYYIVSYSYKTKNSDSGIYTPIGSDKKTIYECTEETFNQLKASE